jgi:hypothetical protein
MAVLLPAAGDSGWPILTFTARGMGIETAKPREHIISIASEKLVL